MTTTTVFSVRSGATGVILTGPVVAGTSPVPAELKACRSNQAVGARWAHLPGQAGAGQGASQALTNGAGLAPWRHLMRQHVALDRGCGPAREAINLFEGEEEAMVKIAVIGASSLVFTRKLVRDLLQREPTAYTEIRLMDVDGEGKA